MFSFEKLEVWQKAVELAENIYKTTKIFPPEEKFGLVSQLQRAAVSISANIAEGSGRGSKKDFLHFINISYGSISEVITLLKISTSEGYMDNAKYVELYKKLEGISKMLSGLARSLGFKSYDKKSLNTKL